jgi:hypothetical protein
VWGSEFKLQYCQKKKKEWSRSLVSIQKNEWTGEPMQFYKYLLDISYVALFKVPKKGTEEPQKWLLPLKSKHVAQQPTIYANPSN